MKKFWFVIACIEWVAAGIAAFVFLMKGLLGLFVAMLFGGGISGAVFYTLSMILEALEDLRSRTFTVESNERIIIDNQFEIKNDLVSIKNNVSK